MVVFLGFSTDDPCHVSNLFVSCSCSCRPPQGSRASASDESTVHCLCVSAAHLGQVYQIMKVDLSNKNSSCHAMVYIGAHNSSSTCFLFQILCLCMLRIHAISYLAVMVVNRTYVHKRYRITRELSS